MDYCLCEMAILARGEKGYWQLRKSCSATGTASAIPSLEKEAWLRPVFSNPEHISFTEPKNQVLDSFVYFERPSQAHAGSVNMALAASISLGEGDEPPEGERHPLVASKRDTEA
jgi:hypothetical protein